jgi:hypothetical protein
MEEVCILCRGDDPRKGLIEMVVSVNQAREHDLTAHIERFVSLGWEVLRPAYLFDESVSREQTPTGDFSALVVHRYQYCRITDEESGHINLGSPDLLSGYQDGS